MGDCPTQFLLNRQKESGSDCKHHEPKRYEGLKFLLTKSLLTNFKKYVNSHTSYQEADAYRECAFRNSAALVVGRQR